MEMVARIGLVLLLAAVGIKRGEAQAEAPAPVPTDRIEVLPAATGRGTEVRIEDLVQIEGVRGHVLNGIGLVNGLRGTGGTNPDTRVQAANWLQTWGNRIDPVARASLRTDTQFKTDSIALVNVTAELPPFCVRRSEDRPDRFRLG